MASTRAARRSPQTTTPFTGGDAEALPSHVQPMLAKLAKTPPADGDDRWAYEVKWDGIRALAYLDGAGGLDVRSRSDNALTAQYPELAGLPEQLAGRSAVLDGEIVAFDDDGNPSFSRLQARMGLRSELTIATRAQSTPTTLLVFDVLHLDGRSTRELPYGERRALLEGLGLEDGEGWTVPARLEGDGAALLEAADRMRLEGIVGKRLDSTYVMGGRRGDWIKLKRHMRQEFVVGGWTEGSGARAGSFGALLLGYHDDAGELVGAGSVGTGFNRAELTRVMELLEPLARDATPFARNAPGDVKAPGKWQAIRAKDRETGEPKGTAVHWVEPTIVCEVEFTEWTGEGQLRHPSYQGTRDDKDPKLVVREG